MNELARSFGGASASYPDLCGNQLTCRGLVPIPNEGSRLHRRMLANTDKSSRDLTRQGNNQAYAAQPDIPPVSVER
jgi:hypothetical protein